MQQAVGEGRIILFAAALGQDSRRPHTFHQAGRLAVIDAVERRGNEENEAGEVFDPLLCAN